MTFAEYIPLAMRTQRNDLTDDQKLLHGVCGLISELSELKIAMTYDETLYEAGDVCWMCAEIADVLKINPLCADMRLTANSYTCETAKALAVLIAQRIQKHLQGSKLDMAVIGTMLGDIMAAAVHESQVIGIVREPCFEAQLDTVLRGNIEKLRKRYPDGFDPERSINRNERL